ncbi:sigma-70 family RNA polymerase sigma factor [Carboxylicivirga mesophila]|uniref:Sigma-70 family RNA polymerase sigma factor n=2 Tax=Carboxylicivirga TaxID=1628153 RepID=A0A941IU66_9BACT|nr:MULTISPECIES: sigma-70 family RNA polymerase sigma factor [Carboxylicivirga]MBR8534616.1 sigma-70 family RNA polymerase sigma factor [Carboxylicivirga sediminis]MBS2211014.1 sigma-70 family RNA polymerase sigma factor [Carboxylicivirga mesophila]
MEKQLVLSDEQLVKDFVAGDAGSIDVLIERHKAKIFSYIVMCVKQQELAEDIFQEAFIRVIRTLKNGRYNDTGKFSSWVMRIAHNLIIDYYRKQKNQSVISNDNYEYDLFNSTSFSDKSIEEQLVYEQVMQEVGMLVKLLPDNQREVVMMRHYRDLSFKEIAEETNVSINTALGRMRYALMNLRRLAEERNISLTLQ